MNNSEKILVAIHCLAYNHEPYIRQCLEGFVMQKTNFRFVAIVHDDASTDKTADIIREYEAKYPDIIKPIYETENQYSKFHDFSLGGIMDAAIDAIGAKYIARCEGDDYWTDPYKLQKQVDILEKDETLMACVTNCSVVDEKGKTIQAVRDGVVKNDVEGRYNLRQFFDNNHQYPTLSVVYRNSHPKEIEEKMKIMSNPHLGDWTLWIALHCFGDFYFLNEVTCAYRINQTSVTHSNPNKRKIEGTKVAFRLIPAVASVLPEGYEDIQKNLRENTAWIWWDLGHAYFKAHKYIKALWCVLRCGIKDPLYLILSTKKLFKNEH